MKDFNKFIDDIIKRSEKFITDVEVWDDYPKDPSYQAISTLLKDVVIPSLKTLKGDKK